MIKVCLEEFYEFLVVINIVAGVVHHLLFEHPLILQKISNQDFERCGLPDLPRAAKRVYCKTVKVEFIQHLWPPLELLRIHLPDFWVMAYEALILPPYILIDDTVYHDIYNIILLINMI